MFFIKMQNSNFSFKGTGLYSLIAGILLFIALFYIAKGVFWVLTWLSPVLLIATLVLDYKVVTDYLLMLWNMILRSPISGILFTAISFVAFPITALYLFGRAWFGYYIRKKTRENASFFQQFQENAKQQESEEFVSYEEIKDGFLDEATPQATFESEKEKITRK
jgi:hypothetical protein